MAVIDKIGDLYNSNNNGISYQQKISVSGAAISDEYILPSFGSHSFGFTTTGSGTIQVTLSTVAEIKAGAATWFDNDLSDGPALSVPKTGFFKGCNGIRINNAAGDSTIEILTKGA